MSTSKVLALRFKLATGKKYNVRIKDADSKVAPDLVQQLSDMIIQKKVFDFDGKQTAYTLDTATFTTTEKNVMIAAPATK